jgi:hypothetical protein
LVITPPGVRVTYHGGFRHCLTDPGQTAGEHNEAAGSYNNATFAPFRVQCAPPRRLDGLIASAARHSRRSIVLSSFYRGELPELRRLSIGPDLVFGRIRQETGCHDILRSLLAERHFGFDVERAVYLTVLHRLIMVSGSDRHAHDWQQRLSIPGAEVLNLARRGGR